MTRPSGDRLALAWSGGKDSAMTVHALNQEHGKSPDVLLTTVSEEHIRVSIHGVRQELIRSQARALDAHLVECAIPADCTGEDYEDLTLECLGDEPLASCAEIAFGDLFLSDVRHGRERLLARAGKTARFPLWKRDTTELAAAFVDLGFRASVVCVDTRVLDRSFAGRAYDHEFLADLPSSVDACGENGEFHTFVWSGPIFDDPVRCELGETVERQGFVFTDLREAPEGVRGSSTSTNAPTCRSEPGR